jgi:hypothetical protein
MPIHKKYDFPGDNYLKAKETQNKKAQDKNTRNSEH